MPETKKEAVKRAKKLGIPVGNVVKANGDGYFIAPSGIKSEKVQKAYADMRAGGYSKEKAAKIANSINTKNKKK